jgi:hypothetical protein
MYHCGQSFIGAMKKDGDGAAILFTDKPLTIPSPNSPCYNLVQSFRQRNHHRKDKHQGDFQTSIRHNFHGVL